MSYSEVADEQLEALWKRDPDLYQDVMDTCEFILDHPDRAKAASGTFMTKDGPRRVFRVNGRPPWKVFWDSATTTIEAVMPYELPR